MLLSVGWLYSWLCFDWARWLKLQKNLDKIVKIIWSLVSGGCYFSTSILHQFLAVVFSLTLLKPKLLLLKLKFCIFEHACGIWQSASVNLKSKGVKCYNFNIFIACCQPLRFWFASISCFYFLSKFYNTNKKC